MFTDEELISLTLEMRTNSTKIKDLAKSLGVHPNKIRAAVVKFSKEKPECVPKHNEELLDNVFERIDAGEQVTSICQDLDLSPYYVRKKYIEKYNYSPSEYGSSTEFKSNPISNQHSIKLVP
tara:strand:+ start:98 stop:463 length:366 start_codon:yes stop_codon:yes gene_type:complete